LEITKYLVSILVKYLANISAKYLVNILAKYLANILPALKGTRDIIGLMVSPIAIAMLPKPADPLDNIKSCNILLIGLGILAKYIYGILIIIAIYSI
jgi:hypothetical protein